MIALTTYLGLEYEEVIPSGASGDLVVSGEMANMVAYLVAKNGVTT